MNKGDKLKHKSNGKIFKVVDVFESVTTQGKFIIKLKLCDKTRGKRFYGATFISKKFSKITNEETKLQPQSLPAQAQDNV